MYRRIRKWIHKRIYNLLIYRTIVLDKTSLIYYDKLDTFCVIEIQSSKGPFKFLFKKDRRSRRRLNKEAPGVTNYIIELEPPPELNAVNNAVNSKLVIVVKIVLFKPDYAILTELLMDNYLDKILNHIYKSK